MKVESLILAGGLSSRMGCPKYSLLLGPAENQRPLLEKLLYQHCHFQREILQESTPRVTISVRSLAQKLEIEKLCETFEVCYVDLKFVVDGLRDAGPISGLIAAYHSVPSTHWLVTGCDYPLLETKAMQQLWINHTGDTWTTCFQNDSGFNEPFLAIWSPTALHEMEIMAHRATENDRRIGPSAVIRAFGEVQTDHNHKSRVVCVRPENELWIKNVNTPSDWQEVLSMVAK